MINIPKPDPALLDALRKAGFEVDQPAAPQKTKSARPTKRTAYRRRTYYKPPTRPPLSVRNEESSTVLKAFLCILVLCVGFGLMAQCQQQARNTGWYSTHK